MRERTLTLDQSRTHVDCRHPAALGAGLGLLIEDKLTPDARKSAGWALLAVGGLTTIPLAMDILGKPRFAERV
jgi:hypothetical protein